MLDGTEEKREPHLYIYLSNPLKYREPLLTAYGFAWSFCDRKRLMDWKHRVFHFYLDFNLLVM